jgi:Winged helix DNA-binding domain
MDLEWNAVRRHRLWRHSLLERAPAGRLLDVVRQTCGIHAQLMAAAEMSIGVRVDVTRRDIRAALWQERRLVKTYGIRGTIHLFAADELPLWMAASRARSESAGQVEARRLGSLGLTPDQVRALVEAMGEALDGRALTLREMGEEVVRRTGPWAAESRNDAWISGWPVWRMALGSAATAGVLCFGPNRGNEVSFVRPDQWFGPWQPVDPESALQEVFRRFLRACGPATHTNFADWFSLPRPAARRLAGSLGDEIVEVRVEGKPLLDLAGQSQLTPRSGASLRLLPHFDCYLRGFHPRQELAAGHEERAAGGTGRVPILLIDGVVAGVWERRSRGSRLEVRVDPFGRLTRELRRELEQEVERVGAVMEAEPQLVIGEVQVRPHL